MATTCEVLGCPHNATGVVDLAAQVGVVRCTLGRRVCEGHRKMLMDEAPLNSAVCFVVCFVLAGPRDSG